MQRFFLFALFSATLLMGQGTNTYLGPSSPVPGNPQLIRVQVLVNDALDQKGLHILEADFDGTEIPLKPRDVYGFRGQASFQKPPGKYKLRWKMQRDKIVWPRTISHEEEVTLDVRDLWIQITITGDSAAID
jgi:hypothetical protein